MYVPAYRKNNKKVPILSYREINTIAENFLDDYMPNILKTPQPFNIDIFVEEYLQLTLDLQYLSNDGRYLGMTIFNDTDHVIIYQKMAEYSHLYRW